MNPTRARNTRLNEASTEMKARGIKLYESPIVHKAPSPHLVARFVWGHVADAVDAERERQATVRHDVTELLRAIVRTMNDNHGEPPASEAATLDAIESLIEKAASDPAVATLVHDVSRTMPAVEHVTVTGAEAHAYIGRYVSFNFNSGWGETDWGISGWLHSAEQTGDHEMVYLAVTPNRVEDDPEAHAAYGFWPDETLTLSFPEPPPTADPAARI